MGARYRQAGPISAERLVSSDRYGEREIHYARSVNEPERERAEEEIARWLDGRDPRHGGFEDAS